MVCHPEVTAAKPNSHSKSSAIFEPVVILARPVFFYSAFYRREPDGVRAEPGKQKTRSCRTQELARSSARENEWQKKGGLLL
jgi:hypothetical protein